MAKEQSGWRGLDETQKAFIILGSIFLLVMFYIAFKEDNPVAYEETKKKVSSGLETVQDAVSASLKPSRDTREYSYHGNKLAVTFEGDNAVECMLLEGGISPKTLTNQYPSGSCEAFIKEWNEMYETE